MNEDFAPTYHSTPSLTISEPLLERYVACECTELEQQEVEKWVAANTAERGAFQSMRAHVLHGKNVSNSSNKYLHDVQKIMDVVRGVVPESQTQSWEGKRSAWNRSLNSSVSRLMGISIAAVLAIVSALSLSQDKTDTMVGSVVTYSTKSGQTAHIELGDGSRVLLNAGSVLTSDMVFGQRARTVDLLGEALFDVRSKSDIPFIVNAGLSTVKVLGTSFVVSNYQDNLEVKIAVRSGRVSVNDLIIDPLKQATALGASTPVVEPMDERMFSFETGMLIIDDAPLGKVIDRLNRWYDVNISLASPRIAELRIDGGFKIDNADNLVWILEQTLNVNVKKAGKSIIIEERVDPR